MTHNQTQTQDLGEWLYRNKPIEDVRLVTDGQLLIVSGYVDGKHVADQRSAHTLARRDISTDHPDVATVEYKLGHIR